LQVHVAGFALPAVDETVVGADSCSDVSVTDVVPDVADTEIVTSVPRHDDLQQTAAACRELLREITNLTYFVTDQRALNTLYTSLQKCCNDLLPFIPPEAAAQLNVTDGEQWTHPVDKRRVKRTRANTRGNSVGTKTKKGL